jgi:hypothetical protein
MYSKIALQVLQQNSMFPFHTFHICYILPQTHLLEIIVLKTFLLVITSFDALCDMQCLRIICKDELLKACLIGTIRFI